jgi:hypothetical protein
MKKKVLGVVVVLIMVCAFMGSSWAQTVCDNCDKCDIGNVPCPKQIQKQEGQGMVGDWTEACPFDYDGDRYTNAETVIGFANGRNGSWGYTEKFNYASPTNPRNCKVVFDVCKCPSACEFLPGKAIGVRMIITTPGVYWADPEMNTIWFDMFTNQELANKVTCNTSIMRNAPDTESVRNFGKINYYTKYTEALNDKGIMVGTCSNIGVPLAGCSKDAISGTNKVIALESEMNTDYVITANDALSCHLWIDIPAMRLDRTAKAGDIIKVRIMLLYDRKNEGLCEACHPPIICECE